MNSYPSEFLIHPQPLMFVAGLSENASAGPSRSSRSRSASVNSAAGPRSRRSSTTVPPTARALDPSSAAGSVGLSLQSPLTSPGPSNATLPTSPPTDRTSPTENPGEQQKDEGADRDEEEVLAKSVEEDKSPQDKEFDRLVEDLRGALAGAGRKGRIWLPEKERKDFKIMLVDKGIRLPLRKVAPQSSSNLPSPVPHSPLSPLTQSSPLYPDGLIPPVWVRKHAELVPSVFVMFLRLHESPRPSEEDMAGDSVDAKFAKERPAKETEQEMDEKLVAEIGDRRRRLGERGIKLTVVLMASTEALDSPDLDSRLSYLRRASALSSKASLFVLTPVPADQLPDFVQSLQDALYDSAMEYYTNHSKRVRRKRSRLPANQYGALLGGDRGRSLGSQGWGVRYDWKAGWFAEVKGETDVARRHYEDCWNELARMFASTQTLPPRTKRWAEAKVLADCVAVKICKLLLYEGGGAKVLGPFFVHLKRFGDLSRGWGIGEDTFEFWSWIARQYRIFAELLDMAVHNGLQLGTIPTSIMTSPDLATSPTLPDYTAPTKSALNPLQILQPPAFYFYMAASCTIQRQQRFLEAQAAEDDATNSEAGAASGYVSAAPGYANEKKVDHAGLIVDLFTKAYDLAKEQTPPQTRIALYLAFRIAETYCTSGQYDLAVRFFERIAPSFQQDRWDPIVKQIRDLWYESAQRTGSVDTAVRLLLEMMSPQSGVPAIERESLQEDLLSVMRTTKPASDEPMMVQLDSTSSFLNVSAGFWQEEIERSTAAPFQVVVECPEDVDISQIKFGHLGLSFSDGRPDMRINPSSQAGSSKSVQYVTLGEFTEADLQWSRESVLVMQGALERADADDVQLNHITLSINEGSWEINLRLSPQVLKQWRTPKGSTSPVHALSTVVKYVPQPQDVKLEVSHHPSGCVDERLPVVVKIKNEDDRDLDIKLSIFLQPAEEEDGSTITYESQESRALLEDLVLGKLSPGTSMEKTVILHTPSPATKIIDFSLQSTVLSEAGLEPLIEERAHTAVIPVLAPFEMLTRIDSEPFSDLSHPRIWTAIVSFVLSCPLPRSINVHGMELSLAKDQEGIELLSSSLKFQGEADLSYQTWNQDTSYAVYTKFRIDPSSSSALSQLASPVGHLEITWRTVEEEQLTETRLPLPPLDMPPHPSGVSAIASPPSHVQLNQPFALPLAFVNLHRTVAISVHVEVSTAENFVWRGNRNIRLIDIQPDERREVTLDLIAVGAIGWCALPKITAWEEVELGVGNGLEIRVMDDRDGSLGAAEGLHIFVRP